MLYAIDIVSPFLLILKSQHLSGPFKLSALETIQCIVGGHVFVNFNEIQISETLGEIVHAVSK